MTGVRAVTDRIRTYRLPYDPPLPPVEECLAPVHEAAMRRLRGEPPLPGDEGLLAQGDAIAAEVERRRAARESELRKEET